MKSSKELPLPQFPIGPAGRVFAPVMESLNRRVYERCVRDLNPVSGSRLLEVGFGTGAFLLKYAELASSGTIYGIDPSPLMHELAQKKLTNLAANRFELSLALGDDRDIPAHLTFDHIVAIHSFQFWEAPEVTLSKLDRMLAENGQLYLVLRNHGALPPGWLPNALSRSANEAQRVCELLETLGFSKVEIQFTNKHSTGVQAIAGERS